MSREEIIVEGTLKPDGTLELDQKPDLSPGRVQVILRPTQEAAGVQEGWWPYMQRIRSQRETSGYHFLSEAEMEAHIQWLREDEDRIDRIHQEIDEQQRQQEKR